MSDRPASTVSDPYIQSPPWWQRHADRVWAAGVGALTVLLTVISFPPVDIPEFAYGFAVPAIYWAYRRPSFRLYAGTLCAAQAVAWTMLLWWLHPVTWAGLFLIGPFIGVWVGLWYLAVWWVMPRTIGRSTPTRLLALLALAGTWVMLEWLRTWFLGGFPWLPLAASQWQRTALLQIAAFPGAYGVSFILIFFNLGFASSAWRLYTSTARGLLRRSPEFSVALLVLGFGTMLPMTEAFNRAPFSRKLAVAIMATAETRQRHIAALSKMVLQKGYDGIDLDWESVLRADRSRFTQFVRALASALHKHHKLLSIAVSAKTSEPGDWFGAQSEDYAKIGAAVDEFKVMTYDYSGSWSGPGPIAPPDWTDAVLTFAESVVPSAKIMMGVPFYGYDWHDQTADSLVWADIQLLTATYAPTIIRDPSGEATFSYTDESGTPHTVFFQDRQAIATKFEMLLALHPKIRGIAIWVMGGESAEFWDEIAGKLR